MQGPFVFLGRGGSGTRLLSRIARDAGIFLGNDINASGDSVEWVPTLYAAARAVLEDGETETVPAQFQQTATAILNTAQLSETSKWGWKLPETMLVVPQVAAAFPQARFVHLVRHPVPSSLRRTHMTSRRSNPVGAAVLARAYAALGIDPPEPEAGQEHLDNAVTWAFQVGRVARFCRAQLPADRYVEITYEALTGDWPCVRRKLAAFLGCDPARLTRPEIDAARARAYDLPDPRVAQVWHICRATAEIFGYGLAADDTLLHSIPDPR